MQRSSLARALIAIMLAALVLGGCGGGMDPEKSATSPADKSVTNSEGSKSLTKAEFISKGDAICEETDKTQEADLKAYLKKYPEDQRSKTGQARMILAVGLPPIQTEAEGLAELEAPLGHEVRIDAIVDGIETAVEEGEEEPLSLLKGEGGLFVEVDKLADDYGFKACNSAL